MSAATVTISYAAALTARIVLSAELRRITEILGNAKKTFGGFGPVPGSVEYWTAKVEEVSAALDQLGGETQS